MDEFFYGTLPQDTQDFSQVLRGVGRNIQDIGRGVSYYPYDLVGAPVDLINMALTPVGLGSERPVLGSDYLRNIAQSLGLAQPSTGSGTETAARFASALINPAAGARAVGKVGSDINRLISMIDETPPRGSIDFSPRQVSSAQQVAQEIMQPKRSDIGFYSQLEAATFPMQDKGTGDQFLAQIQKTAGVKPEEIKYTGLDDFLKGKKSVTKTEIQDYLNANRVDVQEVRLSDEIDPEEVRMFMADEAGEGFTYDEAVDYLRDGDSVTKFSKYTLPGGENYREILLTLPDTKGARLDARRAEIEAKGLNATDAEKQEWASIMNQLQPETRDVEGLSPFRNRLEFRSSHFDQPNVLAHMRVNDRVVDGKKTLFIEEIQSDWHQAGRKKGYKGAFTDLPEGYQVVEKQRQDATYYEVYSPEGTQVGGGYNREGAINGVINELNDTIGGVPDAPFKTSWHELTLKRAIQEASEKGYDQIAFTTGKTQAERYDLSKQVDSLLYSKNPDGTYRVSAQVQNRGQMMGESIPESDLADYVGKEVAEKMAKGTGKQIQVSGKYDPVSMTSDTKYMTELSGEGLKVGGEGMKGFYDNILPKSLEKLGKKFDAKVSKTKLPSTQSKDDLSAKVYGRGETYQNLPSELKRKIDQMYIEDGVEVWQMDITPKMRESVTTKGQPLFAVPAAGLLGAGMSQDEQMY